MVHFALKSKDLPSQEVCKAVCIFLVFGLMRGVVLAGFLIIVMQAVELDQEPWWQESKLIPYAAPLTDALGELAEEGREIIDAGERLEDIIEGEPDVDLPTD